jgi:hypothetical protein
VRAPRASASRMRSTTAAPRPGRSTRSWTAASG